MPLNYERHWRRLSLGTLLFSERNVFILLFFPIMVVTFSLRLTVVEVHLDRLILVILVVPLYLDTLPFSDTLLGLRKTKSEIFGLLLSSLCSYTNKTTCWVFDQLNFLWPSLLVFGFVKKSSRLISDWLRKIKFSRSKPI